MQNRMEMALAVDVKTDVAADAKTDAAADAEFPAAAAAAETAIRGLAVPERPIPAAAAEHRQRTGNAGAYRQGYRDGWNWGYWQGWNDAVWGRNGRDRNSCGD